MKTRLFRTVVAFLFAGLALTQVGCDYGQQIDDLNNRIDELTTGKIASIESQYSSLQTTLSSLQSADAAMTTKIAALEAGSKEVADLKAAQATLQAAIDAVEAQLDGFLTKTQLDATLVSYATAKDVADVVANLGKFAKEADIQAAINEAKAAAIAAAGEAMKESFQTSFDAAFAKAAAGLASTTDVEAKIAAALKTADDAIAAAVKTAIEEYDGQITAAVKEQLDAVKAELIKYIQARLTSLQVIPELFVNGVETVELKSFEYIAQEIGKNEELKSTNKEYTTSALSTTVNYYVSPAQVTNEDIVAEEVEFLCHKAETRAAGDPVEVASASIKDGKLSVSLVKTASNAAISAGDKKTWVGAVKVPIAAKHLTEGEAGAAVISDYVALIEASVKPQIAAVKQTADAAHAHYAANFVAAKSAEVTKTAVYNDEKGINLTALVTGCNRETHAEITPAELKAAGLVFKFAVANAAYEAGGNKADQQKFVEVTEKDGVCYATSKLPNNEVNNAAAVGKTPIIRVALVDVNNNDALVDVQYIKIAWTDVVKEKLEPVTLAAPVEFNYTLSCADFKGIVTWEDMVNSILAKFGENGMSFTDFVANYEAGVITAAKDAAGKDVKTNTGKVTLNNDHQAATEAPALVWDATIAEIGTVMNTKGELTVTEKTVLVKFQSKDEYTYPSYFVTFKMNIKLPYLPQINGYQSAMWSIMGELANVYPVQYSTPGAEETVVYNYDLDILFTDSKIVKDMLKCGKWDIQWAEAGQPEGYGIFKGAVAQKEPIAAGADRNDVAYTLKKKSATAVENAVEMIVDGNKTDKWYAPETDKDGAVNVAKASEIVIRMAENVTTTTIHHPAVGYPYRPGYKPAWDEEITTTTGPTQAAKDVIGQTAVMKVWAQVNPYNNYEVSNFSLNFVEPLKINTLLKDAYFVDQVIEGSKIDCSGAFGLTDFKDYLVAVVAPEEATEKEKYAAELWNYYMVSETAWDLANATINIKKDANNNMVVDDTLTAETAKMKAADYFGVDCLTKEDNILTFMNVNGVKVEKKAKIFVPVTVSYKYGKVVAKVAIDLYPEAPAN